MLDGVQSDSAAVLTERAERVAPWAVDPARLDIEQVDALAVGLRLARDRLAVAVAQVAAGLCEWRGWTALGYAHQTDYARERLGRTGRWLREMAALGRALELRPRLESALTGDDGGAPLGVAAALEVAAVPVESDDDLELWIDRARKVCLRRLRADADQARADATRDSKLKGRKSREGRCFGEVGDVSPLRDPERHWILASGPPECAVAFDEAIDLHRAVTGSRATVASFVEALIAEFRAGPHGDLEADHEAGTPRMPAGVRISPTRRSEQRAAERERLLAESAGHWKSRPSRREQIDATLAEQSQALDLLRWIDALVAGAAEHETSAHRDRRLRHLLETDHRIEVLLAELLASLADRRVWGRRQPEALSWRFDNIAHYAEERLGLSRSRTWQLVRIVRRTRHLHRLADAWRAGRASTEAVLLVLRALGRGPVNDALEQEWTERASRSTIKRLRDEVREISRQQAAAQPTATPETPAPLSDDDWYATIARPAGRSFQRVQRLWQQAEASHATKPLRTRQVMIILPRELGLDFARLLERAARLAQPPAPPAPVQTSSDRGRRRRPRHPAWRGLMALLMDYCATWDPPPAEAPRRRSETVYARDSYRCTAPGCTARRNLEDHHIQYRSQGGDNSLANRTTLCRFHHQRGIHGGLVAARGHAPTGIRFRLGHKDLDPEVFVAELRCPDEGARPGASSRALPSTRSS